LLKKNKNLLTFAWKVSVYITKPAAAQAAFSPEKYITPALASA
jgi:hypothetical protein